MANNDLNNFPEQIQELKDLSSALEELAYLYPEDTGTDLPVHNLLNLLSKKIKDNAEQVYISGLQLWQKSI